MLWPSLSNWKGEDFPSYKTETNKNFCNSFFFSQATLMVRLKLKYTQFHTTNAICCFSVEKMVTRACLFTKMNFFCRLWIATAYNQLDVTICKQPKTCASVYIQIRKIQMLLELWILINIGQSKYFFGSGANWAETKNWLLKCKQISFNRGDF